METALKTPPSIMVKKVINAKREQVFDAWTKPEIIQQWFFPGNWSAKCTNDLRVGGKYQLDMYSDGTSPICSASGQTEGEIPCHKHFGEYLEIKPVEKLVFTWNSPSVTNTRVTVDFTDLGEKTEIRITHELLETEEAREQHNEGWNVCIQNLIKRFE